MPPYDGFWGSKKSNIFPTICMPCMEDFTQLASF